MKERNYLWSVFPKWLRWQRMYLCLDAISVSWNRVKLKCSGYTYLIIDKSRVWTRSPTTGLSQLFSSITNLCEVYITDNIQNWYYKIIHKVIKCSEDDFQVKHVTIPNNILPATFFTCKKTTTLGYRRYTQSVQFVIELCLDRIQHLHHISICYCMQYMPPTKHTSALSLPASK